MACSVTSGEDSSPNNKLLVGPVNKTHNQSTYQCSIEIPPNSFISSVGTITIVGKTVTLKHMLFSIYVTGPSFVMINVDEICTTSITISLNTYSHPACGDVSHNVTISDNVIYPDTIIIKQL